MVTYEVLAYVSQEAFDQCKFIEIEDGLRSRVFAMRLAQATLSGYPIVKLQSSDREDGEVLIRPIETATLGRLVALYQDKLVAEINDQRTLPAERAGLRVASVIFRNLLTELGIPNS
jgi:hypothetical protein